MDPGNQKAAPVVARSMKRRTENLFYGLKCTPGPQVSLAGAVPAGRDGVGTHEV